MNNLVNWFCIARYQFAWWKVTVYSEIEKRLKNELIKYTCVGSSLRFSAGNHQASPKLMEAFRRNESTEPLSASWNGFYALCNVITWEIVCRNVIWNEKGYDLSFRFVLHQLNRMMHEQIIETLWIFNFAIRCAPCTAWRETKTRIRIFSF